MRAKLILGLIGYVLMNIGLVKAVWDCSNTHSLHATSAILIPLGTFIVFYWGYEAGKDSR